MTAFAAIGAVSGAAVAAGPLIGGFITTYFSWRYVFVGEVVILVVRRDLREPHRREIGAAEHPHRRAERAAVGGRPRGRRVRDAAEQGLGMDRAAALPRGERRRDRSARGSRSPPGSSSSASCCSCCSSRVSVSWWRRDAIRSLHVELLSIRQLRSGLSVLGAQYAIIAGLFFMVPVYLQMTLGFDALQTGIAHLPAVDLAHPLLRSSAPGSRTRWSARGASCASGSGSSS